MAPFNDLALALDPSLIMERAGLVPDEWQRAVLRSQAKRQLLLCSRQSGKSTVSAVRAIHEVLHHAPSLVLLLSPSLRQSQELFRNLMTIYGRLGQPAPPDSESSLRMELENGSRVIALPGQEQTVRGFAGVNLLILDEAARIEDGLYHSVTPMMATSKGRILCLSTPWGRRGFFYDAWMQGTDWQRTKVTASECSRIPKTFLEEEKRSMPRSWFDQEYACRFNETENAVFRFEDVEAAFDNDLKPLPRPRELDAILGGPIE